TVEGVHTGAIFGFMNILLRFLDEEKPDYLSVAFDLPAPTFRHEQYGAYKGTRRAMPDELRAQIPTLKELLAKMNVPPVECAGYEADDIIGTLAVKAQAAGLHPVIVSGDKDMLQLATDTVCIRLPKTSKGKTEVETYYAADVLERMGVTPTAYIDVKALMGDTSDNIPGVPGIGEITATKIIHAYESIENAIAHAAEIKPKKASENLAEFAEQARISKMLATIVTDAPVELILHEAAALWTEEARAEAIRLELRQFVKRFAKVTGGNDNASAGSDAVNATALSFATVSASTLLINTITTAGEVQALFAKLSKEAKAASAKGVANTSGVSVYLLGDAAQPVGIALAALGNDENVSLHYITDLYDPFVAYELKNWLESDAPKYMHDAKSFVRAMHEMQIYVRGVAFDTMLAAYAADTQYAEKTLADLTMAHLSEELPTAEDLLSNKGKRAAQKQTFADMLPQVQADFAAAQVYALARLVPILSERLGAQSDLYEKIELPLANVLADMEHWGIRVDKNILAANSDGMAQKLSELTEQILAHAGEDFNIQSTQQLGVILFEKLGLKGGKKTKQGYSTAADVLEKLRPLHPIVGLVLEYRALAKLKSTYIDGLLPLIDGATGRIHSTFRQALTATGRLSSAEPNLQNIPVRTQMGRELRRAFIPRVGCVFVDADYSQIELRVLAHMSGDEVLIQAFRDDADIHRLTASQVLGIAPEAVTPTQRNNAKAVNFGIVYGISAYGLSEDLNIPVWEAEDYIAGYFAQYPRVRTFMNDCITTATETGYASTIFGRRRAVPELKSHNHNIRKFGERVAMNMPIQGTAADLIKIAMIRVYERLQADKLEARLVLQVHDELLLEVPHHELESVKTLVKTEMEHVAELAVPLVVDIHSGESWYETK
ncbi:MAG: DNA polymerase I, partial [Defluviitaleaceae bacterium]|nr:DNA polymerase I [Defluviitaleaceae bacterium]